MSTPSPSPNPPTLDACLAGVRADAARLRTTRGLWRPAAVALAGVLEAIVALVLAARERRLAGKLDRGEAGLSREAAGGQAACGADCAAPTRDAGKSGGVAPGIHHDIKYQPANSLTVPRLPSPSAFREGRGGVFSSSPHSGEAIPYVGLPTCVLAGLDVWKRRSWRGEIRAHFVTI